MPVIRRRAWDLRDSDATPEHMVLGRRKLMAAAGVAGLILPTVAGAQGAPRTEPNVTKPNPRGRQLTWSYMTTASSTCARALASGRGAQPAGGDA